MTWFQNAFSRRIDARKRLWGHLFGGRYKAILIEGNLSAFGYAGRWQRDYEAGAGVGEAMGKFLIPGLTRMAAFVFEIHENPFNP